jgi:AcrR family transcriptional regulator
MTAMEALTDGRKRRSSESREKIVHAMLRLVKAGEMHASAARVAEAAGVGLRSVFRHFEDMEQLYGQMSEIVAERIRPILLAPLTARGWKAQLLELAERRMKVFDEVMPFKVAGSLRRFKSKFLMDDYRLHLKMERATLEAILPEKVLGDKALLRAIEMVTSFQAWRRLRQDQNLSTAEARDVTLLLLARLVG